ncbi:MAG: septal ring lytic transglycosylase RlpA family protein [Alphaproteobacteria bacterium]|nr:septal ring lytic transglycosylase RlpA family protein [Alphaproteobacteria bacterium]
MLKVSHNLLKVSICLLSLTACTDNGLLFRSFGNYGDDTPKATYKIEEPYQIKDEWYTPKENYTYKERGIAGWYQNEEGALTANGEKYDEATLTAMHKTLPLPSMVRITNLENGNVAIVRVNDRGPYVNNRLIDVSQQTAEALEFNMVGTTMVQVEILPEESKKLKEEILRHNGKTQKNGINKSSDIENALTEEKDENKVLYEPNEGAQVIYKGVDIKPMVAPVTISNIVSVTQPTDIAKENTSSEISKESEPAEHTKMPDLITPISGYYIQVGAFSNIENAKRLTQALNKIETTQIYEMNRKDGSILHRVRMGPFETKQNALNILNKLNASGFTDTKIIFEP